MNAPDRIRRNDAADARSSGKGATQPRGGRVSDRTSGRGGSSRTPPSRRRARSTVPGKSRSASAPRGSPRRRGRSVPRRTRCSTSPPVMAGGLLAAAELAEQRRRDGPRGALGEHPGLRRARGGDVADGVDAREAGRQGPRGRPVCSRPRSCRSRGPRRGPGAWGRRGRGRREARCRPRAAPPAAGIEQRDASHRDEPDVRSAKASSSASDVSGDGGTGRRSGSKRVISQALRTPRADEGRAASARHSLGAGGHLKGAPQTPTTARPG